jgi:hypothetical protein
MVERLLELDRAGLSAIPRLDSRDGKIESDLKYKFLRY